MTGIRLHPNTLIFTGAVTGYQYAVELKGGYFVVEIAPGGSLTATAVDGRALILDNGGAITNEAGAYIRGNTGIYVSGSLAKITNAGEIGSFVSTGRCSVGVELKAGGRIDNLATGSIDVKSAYEGVGVEIAVVAGSLSNLGDINACGAQSVGVWLGNGGIVTNDGKIGEVGAYSSPAGYGALSGVAVQLSKGGTVTNESAGQIVAQGLSAISASGGQTTITNAGTISATALAPLGDRQAVTISIASAGAVIDNLKGGVILSADERAIYCAGAHAAITNAGAISGAVELHAGGMIANQTGGTIEGRYAAIFLGYPGQASGGGGVLTNAQGAQVGGDSGVFAAGGVASVTNWGTILGNLAVAPRFGDGVSLTAGGSVVNHGGGVITGARYGIYIQGGPGTITDAGTITGFCDAIRFAGSGANLLRLKTGAVVNGAVIGSTAMGATNTLVLRGAGSVSSPFSNFETLFVAATGQWSLGGVQAFGATTVSTGILKITAQLTTAIDENAAAVVAIAGNATLGLDGASTLSGVTRGAGTLALTGGVTTIASGAALSVEYWTTTATAVTLEEALTYSGAFAAGAGAIVYGSAGSLTLTGVASFTGATTAGGNALIDDATTIVRGLTIAGRAGFINEGSVTESVASVTLGDALGHMVLLVNEATAIWDIADDSGVALGRSPDSAIVNFGLFKKTDGSGVSVIAPDIDNENRVRVSQGTLDFAGSVTGAGVDTIVGVATLEFDSCVASAQTIDFTGTAGRLDLGSPKMFCGALSGFDTVGSYDAVELLGSWSISGYTQNGAAQGALTLSDGTQTANLTFDGAYSKTLFHAAVGSGHTTITYDAVT